MRISDKQGRKLTYLHYFKTVSYTHLDVYKRQEDVGFAPVPAGPEGRCAPLNVHSVNIPKNAKNKERAWHFMQWALSRCV